MTARTRADERARLLDDVDVESDGARGVDVEREHGATPVTTRRIVIASLGLAACALAPPRGLTPLHALRAEGVAGGDALAEAACIAAWGLQDWAVELGELMASVLAARADELSRLTVRPCLWRRRGAGSPL